MPDLFSPDESPSINKRFRRLVDSDENLLNSQMPDDSNLDENGQAVNQAVSIADQGSAKLEGNDNFDNPVASTQESKDLPQEVERTDLTFDSTPTSVSNNRVEERSALSLPAIDEYGMPILGKTEKIINSPSLNGIYPTQKSFSIPGSEIKKTAPLKPPQAVSKSKVKKEASKRKQQSGSITMKQGFGCLIRMSLLALLAGIVILLVGGSFVLYEYYQIAATLPSVADLQQRASKFETTRIYDRNGGLLYEILDPSAGRRTYKTLDKISPYLIAATIATEDKSFYEHPGFDWTAILRAFWQNYRGGETISGASTITQQLARALLFSPEERSEQSYMRKVREALLAAEITRRYTKDQILELYLNEFYYGNLAYGVEAAAETYFNTSAETLTLGQASFLAGLPQAPSVYDVYHNREAVRERQKQVLTLMYDASREEGCIYVSNSPERICVDSTTAIEAFTSLENYEFNPPHVQIRYPHWVNYVRSILESQFDAQTIYRSGFSIYTTIDPVLQNEAEKLVKQQVDALSEYNANDGALVAIKPSTGEILAMVGSADFYNEAISGQVNMATSATRQPGSSIKPITYLAAFEKGWTPASLIWDVPTDFPPSGDPNDPRPPYTPVNYDGRFHGPVTVRSALANSYNIPAVKTLQFAGIYDDPSTPNEDGMISVAEKMGISSLTRPDYGLSLTLGGGEVSLLDMTGAYSVIANAGRRVPPTAISKILDHNGDIVYEYQPGAGDQVIRSEHAFLITSILSDNDARAPMFGQDSVLNLPFPAAVKTGTSNDYRDNWTIGYTPDLAVGVWIGNADYSAMQNISGVTGAAPIWAEFLKFSIQNLLGGNPSPFSKPSGIIDQIICTISGTQPSEWCPNQRSEYFTADQPPLQRSEDLWTKVLYDTWTGLRASAACSEFTEETFALNVKDPWAVGWIQNNPEGKNWAEAMGFSDPIIFAPSRECQAGDSHPFIEISSPIEGQTITNTPLDIHGRIGSSSDFQDFKLEYGIGIEPAEWNLLSVGNQPIGQTGKIYSWDLINIPPGIITLKVTLQNIRGGYAERIFHLNIQVSTPTPTVTSTPSPTFTSTPTGTYTAVPSPTFIPTSLPTSTQTTIPTEYPTPTDTPPPDATTP